MGCQRKLKKPIPPLAGRAQACKPVPLREQATGRLKPSLDPYPSP